MLRSIDSAKDASWRGNRKGEIGEICIVGQVECGKDASRRELKGGH